MRPRRASRVRVWVLWALVAGVVGVGVWLLASTLLGGPGADRSTSASATARGEGAATGPASGPARLREGARQITDPATARAEARAALARVESELAAANGPAEVERLTRKRELIRQAISRLAANTEE